MMNLIRNVLGKLILRVNQWTWPKPVVRSQADQTRLDEQTKQLILYHFEACPFCVKVRRKIAKLGLHIECRDVRRNEHYKKELCDGGKVFQVPCLRIAQPDGSVQWMYESSDINAYLEARFGPQG